VTADVILPCLNEDTAVDAVAVARQAPWSRFAARVRDPSTAASQAGSVLGETS